MVKSVLGVNHQGLRDWKIQRVSALYMAVFTVALLFFIISHPVLSFAEWHHLFAQVGMKIATLLFVLLLLMHTWVGIWTIFTDYVKPFVLRAMLNTLVLFLLAACFMWGVLILWSV